MPENPVADVEKPVHPHPRDVHADEWLRAPRLMQQYYLRHHRHRLHPPTHRGAWTSTRVAVAIASNVTSPRKRPQALFDERTEAIAARLRMEDDGHQQCGHDYAVPRTRVLRAIVLVAEAPDRQQHRRAQAISSAVTQARVEWNRGAILSSRGQLHAYVSPHLLCPGTRPTAVPGLAPH